MKHLVLISRDRIGERMAGPAIRYWEMAKALSKTRKVLLLTPDPCPFAHPNIIIQNYSFFNLKSSLKGAQGLLSQWLSPLEAPLVQQSGVPFILDAYDPMPIEILEFYRFDLIQKRNSSAKKCLNDQLFSMHQADFVICANERQKDLWLGMLLSLGRIKPELYDADPHFKTLIDTVPFGISTTPPVKQGPGIREKLHLREKDKVFLWGGGIWNWFDPLTLIRAIAALKKKRDDIHLVFLGVKHPNPQLPEVKMAEEAHSLAKELNLIDRSVHFLSGWKPYDERQNDLLDSTCGISTHFDNAETRFSFRTRLLDCLWAELPMIVTAGDYFSTLVEKEQLGFVVPPKDEQALMQAMEKIADDETLRRQMKSRIHQIKRQFYWEEVIRPIEKFLDSNPIKQRGIGIYPYLQFTSGFIRERGFFGTVQTFMKKLSGK